MQLKLRVHADLRPTEMQLQTPGASISGVLYLEICDVCFFPACEWHDIPAHVLGTWVQSAMAILHSDKEVMHTFMDGAYLFGLQYNRVLGSTVIRLYECIGTMLEVYTINFDRYLASLRGATKSVIHQAKALGVDDRRDFEDLRSWLQQFIAFENSIKTPHGRSRP